MPCSCHWWQLVFLSACVSQSQYDAIMAQNQQLQQQVTVAQAHFSRLQGAIKYTVNSDLLFPSGSRQTLAPGQQDKLSVNLYADNVPVSAELKRLGITSNDMQYTISQGVKPDMVTAKGFGEANPVAPNNTGTAARPMVGAAARMNPAGGRRCSSAYAAVGSATCPGASEPAGAHGVAFSPPHTDHPYISITLCVRAWPADAAASLPTPHA